MSKSFQQTNTKTERVTVFSEKKTKTKHVTVFSENKDKDHLTVFSEKNDKDKARHIFFFFSKQKQIT